MGEAGGHTTLCTCALFFSQVFKSLGPKWTAGGKQPFCHTFYLRTARLESRSTLETMIFFWGGGMSFRKSNLPLSEILESSFPPKNLVGL